MAYNFNSSTSPLPRDPEAAAPAAPSDAAGPAPAISDNPQSAALVRFRSCRWMQPAEDGNAEFCTHREVKPYAGMAGFDADAWCPDCHYYKLRRAPKKRSPETYT
ncbi:MAG: hypothetical protein HYX77_00285 [Acidobacteria bacterium]|nr:hypothetical protein [Acidobacteriota bacterium]